MQGRKNQFSKLNLIPVSKVVCASLLFLALNACGPKDDPKIPDAIPTAGANQKDTQDAGAQTVYSSPVQATESSAAVPEPAAAVASSPAVAPAPASVPAPSPSPAPAATPPVPDGLYEIKNTANSYCIDAPNGSTNAGDSLNMYPCNQTSAQSFQFSLQTNGYYRISRGNFQASVRGNLVDGAILEQNVLADTANQYFQIVASGTSFLIKIKDTNLVLDSISGTAQTQFSNVQAKTENGSAEQIWILNRLN